MDGMNIHVEERNLINMFPTGQQNVLFLNSYKIQFHVEEYTHEYHTIDYEVPLFDDSQPVPECYIPYSLLDQSLLQSLSKSVLLYPQPGSQLTYTDDVEALFHDISFTRIKTRKMNGGQFLLSTSSQFPCKTLLDVLDLLLSPRLQSGDIILQPWTPSYGSTQTTVARTAQLRLTGLQCNLFTPAIIQHILSPFCMVKKHVTEVTDPPRAFGRSVSSYSCSVWCSDTDNIPQQSTAKLLPLTFTDPSTMCAFDHIFFREMEINIDMTIA